MTQQHPITPPPELVQQWEEDWHHSKVKHIELEPYIAAQAAQWGADQELEACCALLEVSDKRVSIFVSNARDFLQSTRRPKSPSLKEQALEALDSCSCDEADSWKLIRRALEALPDD